VQQCSCSGARWPVEKETIGRSQGGACTLLCGKKGKKDGGRSRWENSKVGKKGHERIVEVTCKRELWSNQKVGAAGA